LNVLGALGRLPAAADCADLNTLAGHSDIDDTLPGSFRLTSARKA
jgi:hypothetical protein